MKAKNGPKGVRREPDRKTFRRIISVPLTERELARIDVTAMRCRMARSRFMRLASLASLDCPDEGPPAADAA
jgi:hypothetical protein